MPTTMIQKIFSQVYYDDSEDIFSIPTDVTFLLQHLLLVSSMVTSK
jgi:hypothetical protein